MRARAPHPFIKYRHLLLVLAIASLAVGWLTLEVTSREDPLRNAFLFFGFIFMWANGAYWALMF